LAPHVQLDSLNHGAPDASDARGLRTASSPAPHAHPQLPRLPAHAWLWRFQRATADAEDTLRRGPLALRVSIFARGLRSKGALGPISPARFPPIDASLSQCVHTPRICGRGMRSHRRSPMPRSMKRGRCGVVRSCGICAWHPPAQSTCARCGLTRLCSALLRGCGLLRAVVSDW